MASDNHPNKIPKTLHACTAPNETASSLQRCADVLNSLGTVLLVLLIICGVIVSILLTAKAANSYNDDALFTFLSSILTWGLYALIEYCIYHAVVVLLRALATITQNSAITANVALWEARKHASPEDLMPAVEPAEGTSHQGSVWTPVEETTAAAAGDTNIQCQNCGCIQYKGNRSCTRCGAFFSEILR